MKNERVFNMSVSSVYPLLVKKAERKGRTKEEVDTIITWLTGYTLEQLSTQLTNEVSYREFFAQAPQINPNVHLITGVICGYRVEEIEDPLMQKIRYLDKLVDELAKGKKMEKILRQPKTTDKKSISPLQPVDLPKQVLQTLAADQWSSTDYPDFTSNQECYQFQANIQAAQIGRGGAYVAVPCDIKATFGKGRLKVKAYFEQVAYSGSIVNMGLKYTDGSICYLLGMTKAIRQQLAKNIGDSVTVTFQLV